MSDDTMPEADQVSEPTSDARDVERAGNNRCK